MTWRGHADADRGQVLLRHVGAHFHFAARARRNSAPAPPLTIWPTSMLRDRIRPASGRDDVEPADPRAGCAELRLGDPDAGLGGVARGPLAVEVGLGHEAATRQRLRCARVRSGPARRRRARPDLRGELRRFLRLDRAVDVAEHLALADPAAGIDQHRGHPSAFAGDPDRLVAPRRKRARCGDACAPLQLRPGTITLTARHLPAATAALAPRLGRAAPDRPCRAEHEEGDQAATATTSAAAMIDPAPPLAPVDDDQRVASLESSFPGSSCHSFPCSRIAADFAKLCYANKSPRATGLSGH